MKLPVVISLCTLWCAISAHAQPLEFSGFLKMSGEPQFVLVETSTHESSGWLKRGRVFAGYTIVDFDPEQEILSVKNAGTVLRLHLKKSKVEDREADLLTMLKDQEARLANGEGDEEGVFFSRIALYSFRRDSSVTLAEKIRIQELIVTEQEKRDARWKSRRATGVATDLDTLERTEDLLRSRLQLAQLKANAK